MVNQSIKAVESLEKFGTVFQKEGGRYKLINFGEYSYPRAIVAYEPYAGGFVKGLISKVRELEVELTEKTMLTRLLTESGRVVGTTGLDLETGDPSSYTAL